MKLAGSFAAKSASRLARALQAPVYAVQAMSVRAPERLHVAPPDIRTADPTVADEIYAGYFSFDGKIVETKGRSPFAIDPPSAGWRRSLAGFSWLRHLRAADKTLARANARALAEDFLACRRLSSEDPAFEPAVVARRTLSWLAQSPILLEEADQDFYERFLDHLAGNARFLLRALAAPRPATERLICAVALAEYCVCAGASRKLEARAARLLDAELSSQIFADGGHVSRNPECPVELLLDLLPLRQVYAARGRRSPERLIASIRNMISFLRLMQHGDGSLALFNGMGRASRDRLATILAHDESSAEPPIDAPQSGYRRLQAGEALVIVDAGPPPPPAFSCSAHAGCLSFEYTAGHERIVVNCGAPSATAGVPRRLARVTAAHSTLVLGDHSSCRIVAATVRGAAEERILGGPREVKVARGATGSSLSLALSHDGYVQEFGLVHERSLALTHDGAQLFGEDRLVAARPGASPRDFLLRFHLHPDAHVALSADGSAALIQSGGVRLEFEASAPVSIEESVFFAGAGAALRCSQLVVDGRGLEATQQLRWSFTRVDEAGGPLVSRPTDI
jgi:uncharacterized heparinase superfamily protein